jgi:hypothetical protein
MRSPLAGAVHSIGVLAGWILIGVCRGATTRLGVTVRNAIAIFVEHAQNF